VKEIRFTTARIPALHDSDRDFLLTRKVYRKTGKPHPMKNKASTENKMIAVHRSDFDQGFRRRTNNNAWRPRNSRPHAKPSEVS
jgi:hypothetical protein